MAQSNGRKKTSNSKKKSSTSTRKNTRRRNYGSNNVLEDTIIDEIVGILAIAITIILFLSNFHIIGPIGDALSSFMFGIFGVLAYVAPLVIFFGVCFYIANINSEKATLKFICGIITFFMINVITTLIAGVNNCGNSFKEFYQFSALNKKGGGIIGGFLGHGLYNMLDIVGTWIIVIILLLICLVILTDKAIVTILKNKSEDFAERGKYHVERTIDIQRERAEEKEILRKERKERLLEEAKERQMRRSDNKVSGVSLLSDAFEHKNDIEGTNHQEIESNTKYSVDSTDDSTTTTKTKEAQKFVSSKTDEEQKKIENYDKERAKALSDIKIRGIDDKPKKSVNERELGKEIGGSSLAASSKEANSVVDSETKKTEKISLSKEEKAQAEQDFKEEVAKTDKPKVDYVIPSTNLLKAGKPSNNINNGDDLRETARRLEMVLESFGVKAEVKDISQGPAVTRYELQPDIGVKVSRIVNLADDIKLNLAAADIRIEAPIPGKAAVGIEVPNSENSAVFLRDLFESKEYENAKSKITFAVGKDIGGNTVVTDLAKMPHLLIAGSTGSGKSVCINTIIMSILYKAKPDEVKLMMIDPKVVELSVYNGIPHLLVPVVTDPKKAAAALRWGVTEMEERYRKFADLEVRDLAGYNAKVESMTSNNGDPIPEKLPQILIIVDELADLMMVASNEVEESICRLAQLARACGIHLIIATQRPSVDVITGLIKANMPSRVAFAVSSGTDSRTILDMNGAEKLLGKGDMLFYPQGKPKPERVQGAFVSDEEVQAVVGFVKGQNIDTNYKSDISEKIESGISSSGGSGFTESPDDRDPLFVDAAKFVMEKEKASIGYLQRVFKIGFNRAARIMDQLEEFGVVGPEQGTKPREVKMSIEQFENALENGE